MKKNIKNINDYKRWLYNVLGIMLLSVVCIAVTVIIVDPYFHYHKPLTRYRLYEERYINDGISRNFDYDSVIVGNSLTQNFRTSQIDELWGCNSIKLPFSGAGYKEIWESISRALKYNKDVRLVLVGMDMEDLDRDSNWSRYNDVPEYLYDNNMLNDVKYIFNKDTLYRGVCNNILMTIFRENSTSFDEYSSWNRKSGPREACESLEHIVSIDKRDEVLFEESDKEQIYKNVECNIIKVVEANPNVRFVVIIPPNSVAKWGEYYRKGQVNYRIRGLEYGLSLLLSYENVEVYAFDDEESITFNLDYYSDCIHYDSSVNSMILEYIYNGEHRITLDNYHEYIMRIEQYYNGYDYTSLNKYID